MARTAECAASEGNRGRDEWMTVIEMQEYMRTSRNKAYDLIWSGEIDSSSSSRLMGFAIVSLLPCLAMGTLSEPTRNPYLRSIK